MGNFLGFSRENQFLSIQTPNICDWESTTIIKKFQLDPRKCLWDSSEGVSLKQTNTENSSGPHMQEIISLADPSPGLFVIAREMRWGRWIQGSGLECNV